MLVWSYLEWWYGRGWRDAAQRIALRVQRIYLDFSVPILLQTLLAPWRRLGGAGGSTVAGRLQAALDTAVSRFIGLMVRLIALVTAFTMITATIVLGSLLVFIWPFIPILGIGLIVWGLVG